MAYTFDQQRLAITKEVLVQVSEAFTRMKLEPEQHDAKQAAIIGLTLVMAACPITELLYHLNQGEEPSDAMLATVRGEMKLDIPSETATLFHLLTAKATVEQKPREQPKDQQ
jgi:hypothetical protein